MKVISFSLWGTNPAFFDGALANIELARSIYPDWKCWFFVEDGCPSGWEGALEKAGGLVTRWPITRGAWEGLFWRFTPIYQPKVETTLVRDCDSRVNPREMAAVHEWLATGKAAHTMRDHIQHQVPMLGGMIGFRHWPFFQGLMSAWEHYDHKGCDQEFLHGSIWPVLVAGNEVVAHDLYPRGTVIPIDEGAYKEYKYDPLAFFGNHDIRPFPEHAPLETAVHGGHVGARVGL